MKTAIVILLLVLPLSANATCGVDAPIGKTRTDLSAAQYEARREKDLAARMWRQKMTGQEPQEETSTASSRSLNLEKQG